MSKKSYVLPTCVMTLMIGGQWCASLAGMVYKAQHGKPFYYLSWPFVDYPMYSKSSGPPIQTASVAFFAETASGQRVELDAPATGLRYFGWRYNLVERLVAPPIDDPTQPELAALVEAHRAEALGKVIDATQRLAGDPPAKLIVERKTYTLEDSAIKTEDVRAVLHVEGDRLRPSATTTWGPNISAPPRDLQDDK